MKVASNTATAEAAVSGFANSEVDSTGQQVTLGPSNIRSMQDGASVANKVLVSVSELISGAKSEADRISGLAAAHEGRDKQDAASMK